jgi:hypothetical protein
MQRSCFLVDAPPASPPTPAQHVPVLISRRCTRLLVRRDALVWTDGGVSAHALAIFLENNCDVAVQTPSL